MIEALVGSTHLVLLTWFVRPVLHPYRHQSEASPQTTISVSQPTTNSALALKSADASNPHVFPPEVRCAPDAPEISHRVQASRHLPVFGLA